MEVDLTGATSFQNTIAQLNFLFYLYESAVFITKRNYVFLQEYTIALKPKVKTENKNFDTFPLEINIS